MFVNTTELQLIIEGQYINNSGFVEPTLTLQTNEIEFLVWTIFPNTTSTQNDNVQIHAYKKYVR